jgi:hypothetical protein
MLIVNLQMRNVQSKKKSRREKLLAIIHIAKEKQGISDLEYKDNKRENFGVISAADLTDDELGSLVNFMTRRRQGYGGQAQALKDKAQQMADNSGLSPERVRGLIKKVCGVENLRWYRGGAHRLRILLARLRSIIEAEAEGKN